MIDVLAGALGAALILVAWGDIVLTLLHPSRSGPLSALVERLAWSLTRRIARAGVPGIYSTGGPGAIALGVATWVGALWLGFGLVWIATADSLFATADPTLDLDRVHLALYYAGISLTTIGLGDVIPASDGARALTLLAGASGFLAFTASISYVISVYPLVSRKRAAAARLYDIGADDPAGSIEAIREFGTPHLLKLHEELVQTAQDLKRFPVLYYFHAEVSEEELTRIVRAGALLAINLSLAAEGEIPGARPSSTAVDAAVRRLTGHLGDRFGVGPLRGANVHEPGFERQRELLGECGIGTDPDGPGDRTRALAVEVQGFLDSLAERHGYEAAPLLEVGQDTP